MTIVLLQVLLFATWQLELAILFFSPFFLLIIILYFFNFFLFWLLFCFVCYDFLLLESWRTDESNSSRTTKVLHGGHIVLSKNPRGRRNSCLILIVKAMEERLNERWEFYYDNRLKHPSEEQEENIRKIDFHKIIKSDGVMYLLTLSTKILEKAKTFSKDGSFNFSYIYAARAEKLWRK